MHNEHRVCDTPTDPITEDTLTHIYNTVRSHHRGHNTVRPHHRGHSHSHLQYSQTPSQRTLSLNISTVFPWLALSLTSTIQSDPITEDTLTHIYNTVRPHHRGHSHSISPLCSPGWHSHFTFLHLPPPPNKEQDEQYVEGQQDDPYDGDSQDDDQRHVVGSQVFPY